MFETEKDIVIIGAGLTGLTIGFYLSKNGMNVHLVDRMDRVGGVIQTAHLDDFTFETGPNTGVFSSPALVRLFDDLSDICKPVFAGDAGNKRWIMKGGKWHALPSGLVSAIRTPLFSFTDKFRILGEPFRKPGNDPDESVADLVRRRMGKSYLDYAVDPFISGIYAGDPEKLVTRYALPKLHRLEQNYGSFIKGAIKKKKEPKTELESRANRQVFSVEGGLDRMTNALAEKIGYDHVDLGISNLQIIKDNNGYSVSYLQNGQKLQINAHKVITTIGGHQLPSVLKFIPTSQLDPVANLKYAKVIQVSLMFDKWDGIPLDAFGGLVPSKEKKKILGILFPSSIFQGKAPSGGAVLSVFMGGARFPGILELSDNEAKEIAMEEVRNTLGTRNSPAHVAVSRYEHAIPQYDITSGERLDSITTIEKENPGLILAGNIRDGIGMSDRVTQGYETAMKIVHSNE